MANWDGDERRKLHPANTLQVVEIADMRRYIEEVHQLTIRHDKVIFGDDGRGGLVRDVDRITQAGKVAAWLMGTTSIATIALTIQQFGKLLFK